MDNQQHPVTPTAIVEDELVARIADAVERRLRGTLAEAQAAPTATTPLQASGLYQLRASSPLSMPWRFGGVAATETTPDGEAMAVDRQRAWFYPSAAVRRYCPCAARSCGWTSMACIRSTSLAARSTAG